MITKKQKFNLGKASNSLPKSKYRITTEAESLDILKYTSLEQEVGTKLLSPNIPDVSIFKQGTDQEDCVPEPSAFEEEEMVWETWKKKKGMKRKKEVGQDFGHCHWIDINKDISFVY